MNTTEDEEVKIESDDDGDNLPLAQHERVGTSLRDLVAQGKLVLKSDTEGTVSIPAFVSTVGFHPCCLIRWLMKYHYLRIR